MDILVRIATMEDVPTLNELISAYASELSKNNDTPKQIDSAIEYACGVAQHSRLHT